MPPCLRSSAAFLSPHSYTFQSVMELLKMEPRPKAYSAQYARAFSLGRYLRIYGFR
jgi:hypothetical protein